MGPCFPAATLWLDGVFTPTGTKFFERFPIFHHGTQGDRPTVRSGVWAPKTKWGVVFEHPRPSEEAWIIDQRAPAFIEPVLPTPYLFLSSVFSDGFVCQQNCWLSCRSVTSSVGTSGLLLWWPNFQALFSSFHTFNVYVYNHKQHVALLFVFLQLTPVVSHWLCPFATDVFHFMFLRLNHLFSP